MHLLRLHKAAKAPVESITIALNGLSAEINQQNYQGEVQIFVGLSTRRTIFRDIINSVRPVVFTSYTGISSIYHLVITTIMRSP